MCFIGQASLIDTIKPLVGVVRIKPAEGFDVWTDLQIIEQWKLLGKRGGAVAAAVLAGFQAVTADHTKGKPLLLGILTFAHQADTGNQPMISPDQRIQIRLQRIADILPEIGRMAAMTAIDAVGDRQCETDLPRNFSQRHGCFNIFQRLSHRRYHGGCSIRSKCDCRLW